MTNPLKNVHYRGCLKSKQTGLNIIIVIVQKEYEWSSCPFVKMIFQWGIILAKGQFDQSYTFWTMSILIFSPVYLLLRHPLCTLTGTYCNSVLDKIYRILKKGQRIFMVACLTLFLVKLLNTKKTLDEKNTYVIKLQKVHGISWNAKSFCHTPLIVARLSIW